MKCELYEATERPEYVACAAARNDYEKRWVGDNTFEQMMEPIEPADRVPSEVWNSRLKKEYPDHVIRRMWTLVGERLLKHGHYGPFEHPQATFAIKGVSRSLMAQLTRHRHATFDIQSMRYVDFEDANPEPGEAVVEIPELDDPGLAGRNAEFADVFSDLDDDEVLEKRQEIYESSMKDSFMAYNELLDLGAAPENARMVLPIGTKVNIMISLNARTLMHVADMRAAADAQWEIREMTEEVLDLAEEWMPMTFHYYNENLKNRKNRLAP